ncbi:MAG: 4-hydroxy-3-methylbut-2-enyl diphosphate reductase [Atopobiaceae bacterium]|jgi:4-hydroxy-3-methylbut-2-enyl diphosphate reductase|nr:4-hydroxy-3-methylbut-2-enyl diphosphate reductase [Atopobiaceae bacterium]MCI2173198.1 4-hydroxy-3-methylbut-2-enyl diphosphate reductase [Atopobiaceae bacterium]MCI2207193.1 4-hydroxy-3-methylbut-2-enyl diphosphate reductase [Atopobiaceae bacterium]
MAVIRVADQAGACYGVERALDLVHAAIEDGTRPVRTLGPLIHNPQVVRELEDEGVRVVDEVPTDATCSLVIRSHGVTPEVMDEARERGMEVIDATCPYVKKAQHAAERLHSAGYQVIVVGESGHPEVEGILAHAPRSFAISSASDLAGHALAKRVGIVVQTTQSLAVLEEVVSAVVGRVDELRVMNTICSATTERQRAAADLARDSDVMIVIGGRNSANTTRLAKICSQSCSMTHHIESPTELEADWFMDVDAIGVTAGASTPASQIEGVVSAISSLMGEAGDEQR